MDRYRVAPARPVYLSGPSPSGGAEIGIFTAERYFSAADVVRRHDAALLPHTPLPKPNDHHHHHEPPTQASDAASLSGRTTAASSEASWNSRSGLLSAGHHSAAVGGRVKGKGSSNASGGNKNKKLAASSGLRWSLFGRDCPCAGRKAVVTADAASSEPRSPATDARFSAQSAVEECLESAIFKARPPVSVGGVEEPAAKVKVTVTPGSRAFPLPSVAAAPNRGAAVPTEAFGRRAGGFAFPTRFSSGGLLGDDPPRASLEVFRPIDEDSVVLAEPPPPLALSASASRGRDLVLRAPPPAAALVADEEAMSDASSDLFDLESFAASSSYPATSFRGGRGSRRNSDDDDRLPLPLPYAAALAEPALSECGMYAPSEASVVWSVATAEGGAFDAASAANFSSAASACGGGVGEFRFVGPDPESPAEFAAGRKKGGGFLDSCRCEKAVSVGPTPVRMVKPPAYPDASAAKMGSGGAVWRHPGRVHVPVRT